MLLLFLVVATATRCPLNEDSNDNAQSSPLRIDFAAFPAFPAEVVVAPRKLTPNPLRLLSSSKAGGFGRARWVSDKRCKERSHREASAQSL
jgi:hypothetical protein